MTELALDPRTVALVGLVGRCGATSFRIEHTDPDNGPVVWVAVAELGFLGGAVEAAAAADPYRAVVRLAEQLIDGGTCRHCGAVTGVLDEFDDPTQQLSGVCWYVYDPELDTFRRGCE